MMGLYIRDVEMPTKGYRLILVHADGTVQTTDGETTAISVSSHGDLIDKNELKENCMKEDSFLAELLFRKVSNATTIIPAEDGEI